MTTRADQQLSAYLDEVRALLEDSAGLCVGSRLIEDLALDSLEIYQLILVTEEYFGLAPGALEVTTIRDEMTLADLAEIASRAGSRQL